MNYLASVFEHGVHATHYLRALGHDHVAFDGDAPVFDQPLHILAFTNRCGSNHLAELLRGHPGLRGFGEPLNHDYALASMAQAGLTTFPDYIRHVATQLALKPGQSLGLKASADQLRMLLSWGIDRMFPGLRVLHLERLDLLGQAISYHIANQTGQWTSEHQPQPDVEPTYDFDRISNHIVSFSHANDAIALTAEVRALPYLRLTHEEVTSHPQDTIHRVFDWASLPAEAYRAPKPRLQKQASALSDEFRARFHEDFRAASGI